MDLKLPTFQVYPHQNNFISTKEKFPALVAGYGAGKTYSFCLKALAELGRNPTKTILLSEPTFGMVRDVLQPTLEEVMDKLGFRWDYYAGAMTYHVRWNNGFGKFILRSAENWRRWAGLNLAAFGIDEASSLKDDSAWKMGISRLRDGDHLTGWTTTPPEGFNWHYNYWKDKPKKGYYLIQAKSTANKHLPKEFIDTLIDNYDKRLILAYLDGEYVNLQHGQVYYGFDRAINVKPVKYNPYLPIRCAIDFNVNPMCAVLWQMYQTKPKIRVFDEVVMRHSGGTDLMTERLALEIKQRYPYENPNPLRDKTKIVDTSRHYIAYPDPSGKHKRSSSFMSDHDILIEEGFGLRVKKCAPLVTDSVNAVNKAMEQTIVDPKCEGLIKDFEQVVFKDNTRTINKSNLELTHLSDGFRYSIDYEFPVKKPITKTFMA